MMFEFTDPLYPDGDHRADRKPRKGERWEHAEFGVWKVESVADNGYVRLIRPDAEGFAEGEDVAIVAATELERDDDLWVREGDDR